MEQAVLVRQLTRHRSYFPGPHLDLVIESMLAGNMAGALWDIPQDGEPPLLLLWDRGNNVLYFTGDVHQELAIESVADIVASQVWPACLAEGRARFKARVLSPSLEEHLPSLLPDLALRRTCTLFFAHDADRSVSSTPATVDNIAYLPITPAVLSPGAFAYSDYVLGEICSMWPSEERFHEHGFGIVAVLESEIICWCTAEYVSPICCGIGIETSPRFERRGVATASASHFVQMARERAITPYWECDSTNHGSVRVAEKVGFVRQTEETYWIGSFDRS